MPRDEDERRAWPLSYNACEAIHSCVWGSVALAFIVFLCLSHRGCIEGEYREKVVYEQNRAAVYRAQTEGCRSACGDNGVREVTEQKCVCD